MYIDKIYTKLYSNKDWDGLAQLVSEIKSFAMTERDKAALNAKLRLAKEGKLNKTDWMSKYGYVPTSSNAGVNKMTKSAGEGDFNKFISNKENLTSLYEPGAYGRSRVNGEVPGDGSYKDFILNQMKKEREKIHADNAKRDAERRAQQAEIDRKNLQQSAMDNFQFI